MCPLYEGLTVLGVIKISLFILALDSAEENGYVGSAKGVIYSFCLKSPPRDLKLGVDENSDNIFRGHEKAVTCLSVSLDGQNLGMVSNKMSIKTFFFHKQF